MKKRIAYWLLAVTAFALWSFIEFQIVSGVVEACTYHVATHEVRHK